MYCIRKAGPFETGANVLYSERADIWQALYCTRKAGPFETGVNVLYSERMVTGIIVLHSERTSAQNRMYYTSF